MELHRMVANVANIDWEAGSSLSDEWWAMSWWDQTGRKGDDWERRMDRWHAQAVSAGMEPLW